MSNIKVDHSQFENTASVIDTYVNNNKTNNNSINDIISGLSSYWDGKDYNQVKHEWNQINSNSSTSIEMLKALSNYAEFLRLVGKKYKSAQANAINRANRLP